MAGVDDTLPSRPSVPAAKLAAPRPIGGRVRRDRLLAALESTSPDQVVLLSAPAGHGKTTLLAEWCDRARDRTAWVSLDQTDRAPNTLWSAILAAVLGCSAVPADSPLHQLDAPHGTVGAAAFADRLTTGLAGLTPPLRLVLDDLHVLVGSEAMTDLESVLVYLRGSVQIVLATRSDPALPLARWRVEGRLVEVRSDRLAFTAAETRDLVERTGLRLSDAQISTLVEQTGGWAAGLRLATMSLATTDDPDSFLTDLAGNDRAIADYLVSEVLSRLPAESLTLLRRLSVCDQISASLAESLTGTHDAVELLCALERDSSLVVSHGAGRQWFRIHPLLRAYLKADLRRSDPRQKERLYAAAAHWYAADADPAVALRYAARSNDPAITAAILHEHALTLLSGGRFDVLRDAWPLCPTEAIDADPTLALVLALAFLDAGESTVTTELAARADRALAGTEDTDDHLRATHHWLRALVRVRHGWLSGGLVQSPVGDPELDDLPTTGSFAERALSHLASALASAANGDLPRARRYATASLRAAELSDQPYVAAQATVLLSAVAVARGELRQAGLLAARADAQAPPSQWCGTPEESVTAGIRSYAALMAGDPTHAIILAAPSLRFPVGELAGPATAALATMVVAVAHHDQGHQEGALARLREVRESIPTDPLSRRVLAVASLWEQEIALASGRTDHARDLLATVRRDLGPIGDVAYLSACSALARGRREAASDLLDSIVAGRHPPLTPWVEVAARVQSAQLALDQRRHTEARRLLTEALRLADRQGALRPLIGAPEAVIDLLATDPQLLGGEHAGLILTVLGLRADDQLRGSLPLTPRELEVLAMLPNLCSVGDIAADLSVSVNTVKTHLKSIYDKLGVDSRRKAVEAGRRFGYLAS